MKYVVQTASGKGMFTVEADSVDFTDTWVIFRKGGADDVHHAFASERVTHVALLDEETGAPRMDVYTEGRTTFEGLSD